MRSKQDLGESLIFLISLPRSGSTLLQHILASHSKVAATAEPWILFPAVCALQPKALTADYNPEIGRIALTDFLAQLDGGEEAYYAAVRKLALDLYNAYLDKRSKERFLDKTSRYYLVLPELYRIFPKAKFVFLFRNPLAVLASFLEVMVVGNWKRLGEPGIRNDLLDGYRLIRRGIRYFGDDAIVVKYEELVEDPEIVTRGLCEKLGLEFEPEMLNYGEQIGVLPGKIKDPKSIQKHHSPVKDYARTWQSKFKSRQEKHFAQAFLTHLGSELVNSLGYRYEELESAVAGEVRGWTPLVRWDMLMIPPQQRTLLQRLAVEIASIWQQKDMIPAIRYIGKQVFKNLGALPFARRVAHRVRTRGFLSGVLSSVQPPEITDYQVVRNPSEMSPMTLQAPSVAERQLADYVPLLKAMYEGKPRQDFVVAAQALRLTNVCTPKLLEIGCGNGYYYEILSHLTTLPIEYTGLDSSPAMIKSARGRYPDLKFMSGDATQLPFAANSFDIAWSGTVLMHLVDYKKAIEESCRVARRYCVFHSTLVLADGASTASTQVPEVIIRQVKLESLLHEQGLIIRHVLESLPYPVDSVVGGSVQTLTYVCEKS